MQAAEVQIEHQNGKKIIEVTLNMALLFVPHWLVFQAIIYWDFPTLPSLGFKENGLKKENRFSMGENVFFNI